MLQVQWCLIVSNADADARLIRASMLVNAPASQLLTCHLSLFFRKILPFVARGSRNATRISTSGRLSFGPRNAAR
jgi:hypothetical protein